MEQSQLPIPTSSEITIFGPTGLVNSPSNPYITTPAQIKQLLAKLSEIPEPDAIKIITELTILISGETNNSFLLYYKNTPNYNKSVVHKEFDLINHIIENTVKTAVDLEKFELHKAWYTLFKTIINSIYPLRQHYLKIYEMLSKSISQKFPFSFLFTPIKMLSDMNLTRIHKSNEPHSYFFFTPPCSLSTPIGSNSPWPFPKGFTIMMWIKTGNLLKFGTGNTPVLLRFRSSTKGFECYVNGYTLNYRILSISYTKPSIFAIRIILK